MYAIGGRRSLSDAVGRRSSDPSCGTIYRQITVARESLSNIVFGFCFEIPRRVDGVFLSFEAGNFGLDPVSHIK